MSGSDTLDLRRAGVRSPPLPLEFSLQVSNTTLRHALSFVGARAGLVERKTIGEGTVVVHDSQRVQSVDHTRRRRVLVVDPTPLAARAALLEVTAGTAMAVFFSDDPDEFIVAMESLAGDRAMIPGRLIDTAKRMPPLTERQLFVIAGVVAGQSNRDIARSLHFSDASVKRAVAELFRYLGVSNRIGLTTVGLELGIRPNSIFGQ